MISPRFSVSLLFLLAASAMVTDRAEGQDAAAILVQFRGEVAVVSPDSVRRDAAIGMSLLVGEAVLVSRGSNVVFLFSDGRMSTATSDVTITDSGARSTEFNRVARRIGTVLDTPVPGMGKRGPGDEERPALALTPTGGVSVLAGSTTFRWASAETAEGYMVQLEDTRDGAVVTFEVGQDTAWSDDGSDPVLTEGATYRWRAVTAEAPDEGGWFEFRVLDADELQVLSDVMANLEANDIDPATDGLFVVALIQEELGLAHEAADAIRQLEERDEAELGAVFWFLKSRVMTRLGRTNEAADAFRRAMASG